MTRRLFGDVEWKFAPRWQLTMGRLCREKPMHTILTSPSPTYFPTEFCGKLRMSMLGRMGFSRVWQQDDLFLRKVDIRIIENGRLLAQPYIPNPDLRPARFDNAELGYFGRFPALGVTLDARVFHERAHRLYLQRAGAITTAAGQPDRDRSVPELRQARHPDRRGVRTESHMSGRAAICA